MEIQYAYEGTLKGIKGVWTDTKPKGLQLDKEIMFLVPSEGYILQNKETKIKVPSIIIQDETEQNNWIEIEKEKIKEIELER